MKSKDTERQGDITVQRAKRARLSPDEPASNYEQVNTNEGKSKKSAPKTIGPDDTSGHNILQDHSIPSGSRHSPPHQPIDTALTASERVPPSTAADPDASSNAIGSTFRNVSACNRCRVRKNRCDQRLPACMSCEKAGVRCVGYDAITKKEVPRSYVFHLETRVHLLEDLLRSHQILIPADNAFGGLVESSKQLEERGYSAASADRTVKAASAGSAERSQEETSIGHHRDQQEEMNLDKLVSNIGMVSVQGTSEPRYLGSTSGISFARVVFAAVKSSVSAASSERAGVRPSRPTMLDPASTSSMRDSFFGLHTKPTFHQAPFPNRDLGRKLTDLYFEYSNPQVPILHRGEFMKLFDQAYSSGDTNRTARQLFMLNIVFAIGAAIFSGDPGSGQTTDSARGNVPISESSPFSTESKQLCLSTRQYQPEEYHASAITHLESFLGSSLPDRPDGSGGGLEELQAVLLLSGFALLRPVAPGLWYIVGVAVRLAVDLGLHYEDGADIHVVKESDPAKATKEKYDSTPTRTAQLEKGRRQWMRDLRRRLWWCVYSFDRLVSTCVGRPVGITDQAITTEFPSPLDDAYIQPEGFLHPPENQQIPTYKAISYHYFRLRLLQSEILQVLQYQQSHQARANGANRRNEFMHTQLPSPFLQKFPSFQSWRRDVDRRLWEWRTSIPAQHSIGVQFSTQYLELNYWQAVVMLYRQSLSVPPPLADQLSPVEEEPSPPSFDINDHDEKEEVYLKVAEAGQKVLRIYRQLHRVRLVNYTYLATHHLFMAGISFLYAIWHSSIVRSRLTMDDVDFTVLAATSVLSDLIDKCPPAEACRDAFESMSKTTVQMCLGTTGFGSQALARSLPHLNPAGDGHVTNNNTSWGQPNQEGSDDDHQEQPVETASEATRVSQARPAPRFDMNLRDLFSSDENEEGGGGGGGGTLGLGRVTNDARASSSRFSKADAEDELLKQPGRSNFESSTIGQDYSMVNSQTLDFLDRPYQTNCGTSNAYNTAAVQQPYAEASSRIDFESSDFMNDVAQNGLATSGVDLGFGLGLDVDHDWSNGAQIDLFDGFFFGNGI